MCWKSSSVRAVETNQVSNALAAAAAAGGLGVPVESMPAGFLDAALSGLRMELSTTADGVVLLDSDGQVVSINTSAEVMFGYQSRELTGLPFASLLNQDSQRVAQEMLDRINRQPEGEPNGRDVIGRRSGGAEFPLFITLGAMPDGNKRCAVVRDLTLWKQAERELVTAKREAERASGVKSDFLAKISHEIRTPLNAMIGFSEVMMQERFGPVGNERYKQYLKDIHASGGHVISLLNDLLDLSKIEAGKLELNFGDVDLNDLTQQCVAMMQPQANRERVIIRSSFASRLPDVVAAGHEAPPRMVLTVLRIGPASAAERHSAIRARSRPATDDPAGPPCGRARRWPRPGSGPASSCRS